MMATNPLTTSENVDDLIGKPFGISTIGSIHLPNNSFLASILITFPYVANTLSLSNPKSAKALTPKNCTTTSVVIGHKTLILSKDFIALLSGA